MRALDRIVYAVFLCGGIFVMYQGREWGIVLDKTPGPGFMPFWDGVLMVIASLLALLVSFLKKSEDSKQAFTKADLRYFGIIIGGAIFVAIFAKLIGLLVSIVVMTAVCGRLMGMKKMWVNAAVSVGMLVTLYLLFALLLEIPLPKNLLNLI
jgi:sorbitol-specific phosphotransferase system component IIC